MSNQMLRLETSILGDQAEDPKARRIAELEGELRQLRREVSDARLEADRAREDASRALSMLRGQLSPLYRALQAVFGELDAAGVPEAPIGQVSRESEAVPQRVSAVWDAWKQKLPPACGKVIDALFTHSDLSRSQLKVVAQIGSSTVDASIGKLSNLGLLTKNGGRYSLKQL